MIKRLYVDNFRCMVNFEYLPGTTQLLFGENGAGKTTTFDVLERLRDLIVWGSSVISVFPSFEKTVWLQSNRQTFELELVGPEFPYKYSLIIEHQTKEKTSRIVQEEVKLQNDRLYYFDGNDVHLYGDDFSEGPIFPTDSSRSALASIPERDDNNKLTWFKQRIAKILFFSIDPNTITSKSSAEEFLPKRNASNFSSWYRRIVQEVPQVMQPLFQSLKNVIPDFQLLQFVQPGHSDKYLTAVFKNSDLNQEYILALDNLSAGQKCLIALFSILQFAKNPDVTLCLDEPDNYIALRELRPWLLELLDTVSNQKGSQCLIISHHPEFIDELAREHGIYFERIGSGHVRPRPLDQKQLESLTASELMARGWQ